MEQNAEQSIDIRLIQQKCAILNGILKLKPTGFGFGGFQQQVSDPIDPRDYNKTADEICDTLSIECNVSRDDILKNIPLCFDGHKYSQITYDTNIYLADIDAVKIGQSINTLHSMMPKAYWVY